MPVSSDYAGRVYVIFGTPDGLAPSFDLKSLDGSNGFQIVEGPRSDGFGASVSSAGDINGDGVDDLLIGSARTQSQDAEDGGSYVLFGSRRDFPAIMDVDALDGENGFAVRGFAAPYWNGAAVSAAGDFNADGYADMVFSTKGANGGSAYVVFGKATGYTSSLDVASLDGANGFKVDFAGGTVGAAGDVNGDGMADLVFGGLGTTHVIFGAQGGLAATLELAALDGSNGFVIEPTVGTEPSRHHANGAGDINGDGYDDLIVRVAAAQAGERAEYSVILGKGSPFGSSLSLSALDGSNGFHIVGGSTFFGPLSSTVQLASAGDMNADGLDDMIIGARTAPFARALSRGWRQHRHFWQN